jgi:hypothetical protein
VRGKTALTLDGLIARFRSIGLALTDIGTDNRTWVLTPRDGSPIVIGNPTNMSDKERFELFEIIRNRIDPFGSMH